MGGAGFSDIGGEALRYVMGGAGLRYADGAAVGEAEKESPALRIDIRNVRLLQVRAEGGGKGERRWGGGGRGRSCPLPMACTVHGCRCIHAEGHPWAMAALFRPVHDAASLLLLPLPERHAWVIATLFRVR